MIGVPQVVIVEHLVVTLSYRKAKSKVARSNSEVKYKSMAKSATGVVRLKQLVRAFSGECPNEIMECNQAAIHIGLNSMYYEKTKHIEIDCHYIREKVNDGIIYPSH